MVWRAESSALTLLYLGFWNYPFHVLCFARYYGVSMLSIVDFLCYLLSLYILVGVFFLLLLRSSDLKVVNSLPKLLVVLLLGKHHFEGFMKQYVKLPVRKLNSRPEIQHPCPSYQHWNLTLTCICISHTLGEYRHANSSSLTSSGEYIDILLISNM